MGFNKGLIIGSLILSLFGLVFTGLFFSFAAEYDIDVDPEYEDIFDQYEETKQLTDQQNLIIEGGEINPEGFDQAVYKNVIVAGKNAQQSGNIMLTFLNQFGTIMNIPVTVIFILSTLILTLITFGFIYLISGRSP